MNGGAPLPHIRTAIQRLAPCLVWTLALGIAYSFCAYKLSALSASGASSYTVYYCKGFALLPVLLLLEYTAKRLRHFLSFAFVGIALALGAWALLGCVYFAALTCTLWFMHLLARLHHEPCTLTQTSWWLLLLFPVYFLVTSATQDNFFQKMVLYHFVFTGLLIFAHKGLARFDAYIALRQTKAQTHVPIARIHHHATRIFAVGCALVLLLLCPIIETQYQFFILTAPTFTAVEVESPSEEEATEESQTEAFDLSLLIEESTPNPWLEAFWAAFERVMRIALYGGLIWCIVAGLYKMIRCFREIEFDKSDVIESTLVIEELQASAARRRRHWQRQFDFSEEMKIRRRYQKTMRKHRPKPWQTPCEMEEMANENIPELHAHYEKARYGKPQS